MHAVNYVVVYCLGVVCGVDVCCAYAVCCVVFVYGIVVVVVVANVDTPTSIPPST